MHTCRGKESAIDTGDNGLAPPLVALELYKYPSGAQPRLKYKLWKSLIFRSIESYFVAEDPKFATASSRWSVCQWGAKPVRIACVSVVGGGRVHKQGLPL